MRRLLTVLVVASCVGVALLGMRRPAPVDPYETRVSLLDFALVVDGVPGVASAGQIAGWASPVLEGRGGPGAVAAVDALQGDERNVAQFALRGAHPETPKREIDYATMWSHPILTVTVSSGAWGRRLEIEASVRLAERPPSLSDPHATGPVATVYRESTTMQLAPGQTAQEALRRALPSVLDDYGARIGAAR